MTRGVAPPSWRRRSAQRGRRPGSRVRGWTRCASTSRSRCCWTATLGKAATDPESTTRGSDSGGPSPARCSCGGKQTVAVVLDLATALGLADNPGRVPGYGLVPADLAREIAADRDFVRWLVAPDTGELLDVGADTYRPSDRLARFIRARDQHCGFPGCHRPAVQAELDHVRAFGVVTPGGKTVRVNLGPLCEQHHNAKTHGGWRLTFNPATRTKTWTSPLGHTYTTTSAPLLT